MHHVVGLLTAAEHGAPAGHDSGLADVIVIAGGRADGLHAVIVHHISSKIQHSHVVLKVASDVVLRMPRVLGDSDGPLVLGRVVPAVLTHTHGQAASSAVTDIIQLS
jgi:hypothetical protein